jgi:hypothetical protein
MTYLPTLAITLLLLATALTQENLKTLARMQGGTYDYFSRSEMPAVSLQEVAKDCDLIVYGRIVESKAELTPDELSVRTVYGIHPLSFLKDRLGLGVVKTPGARTVVSFAEPGGVVHVDGLTISFRSDLATEPKLSIGDEVVVFLKKAGADQPLVKSFGPYGLLRVAGDRVSAGSPRVNAETLLKTERLVDVRDQILRAVAESPRKN